jgi:hypothetical protein
MVKYDGFYHKDQIPPQDFLSGYDLQCEISFYFPRMYGTSNCAALVDVSIRH